MKKTILLVALFLSLSVTRHANSQKIEPELIVTRIIAPLLILEVPVVNVGPFICESPVIDPLPGPPINVSNCSARGLRAAFLNRSAGGLIQRGNFALACERIQNYRNCGFPLELPDPGGRQFCDQFQRSVETHGIVASNEYVFDICITATPIQF